MTTSDVDPQLESTPVIEATLAADGRDFQRAEYPWTVAAHADPMKSETIKGWLKSGLRAPK